MELEELADAIGAGFVEPCVRSGEGLEPLEVAREGGRVGAEGLRVCRQWVDRVVRLYGPAERAGLGEELAVLLENLEVFLFFCVFC